MKADTVFYSFYLSIFKDMSTPAAEDVAHHYSEPPLWHGRTTLRQEHMDSVVSDPGRHSRS